MEAYSWSQGGGIYGLAGAPGDRTPPPGEYADAVNFHMYPWDTTSSRAQTKTLPLWEDYSDPRGSIAAVRDWIGDEDKPLVATEWGYATSASPEFGVIDDESRAKYIARNTFEIIDAGLSRAYYYSLVDHHDSFGIANEDGSLQPAGQTLANIFTLLEDSGTGDPAAAAGFTLSTASGMPVTDDRAIATDEIHHSTFVKSDGSTWVAIWVDSDSHEGERSSERVTFTFEGSRTVTVHTPMDGTAPGQVQTG